MKKTITAFLISFTFANSAYSADLSRQECLSLRDFAFSGADLISVVHEYQKSTTANLMQLTLNDIEQHGTIQIMQPILQQNNDGMGQITQAIEQWTDALSRTASLVESCP